MSEDEAIIWLAAQKEKLKEERKIKLKKYWENLKPFERIQDIPSLPQVEDPEEWKNFYVKKLIQCGAIPKEAIRDRAYYLGKHRQATVARWCAEKNKFEYWRTKFGARYIDDCNHFEDDDGFALFVPLKEATEDQFISNIE